MTHEAVRQSGAPGRGDPGPVDADVLNGQGKVILTGYRPVVGRVSHHVEAAAHEDYTGFAANWSLTAHALCAPPVPGWELVKATNAWGSASNGGAIVLCAPGSLPLGMGGWIGNPGAGQVNLNDVYVTGNDGVGVIGMEDDAGYLGLWNATAYAICAPPIPGHETVYASYPASVGNSSSFKSLVVACPLGTQVHGIGEPDAWLLRGIVVCGF